MRAFDPAGLFEATREPGMPGSPYRHLADELDAVERGDKAMSAFSWTRDDVTGDDFVARAEAIFDRGLTLVLDPHEDQHVTAFALHTDELWRVPAWRVYSDARHGSSEAGERQSSRLLGYTAKQLRGWLAYLRWMRVERGHTLYAVLDRAQLRRVTAARRRSLGPPASLVGLTVFDHHHLLLRDAARRVPREMTLVRFGVTRPLRHPQLNGFRTWTLTAATARTLDATLCTRIELLGARGWR